MKIKFSTLISLTFVTVALLIPFVLSPWYLPMIRESNFDLHLVLQGELYKQITGYVSLFFIIVEMILVARKRGQSWKIKVKLPGSLLFWRSLHIFVGIALLGTTLIHTVGSQGLNFNAIFLWVFFGVVLSALMGSVAELGILESPQRSFSFAGIKANGLNQKNFIPKGVLIRKLRLIWLNTHIFLVTAFMVMLIIHIIIAYYYQ
ncbi:MAG: hypothetical protein F6K14_12995 [Symploca sp. SIO2C1]|nr:hypothetical protein [Symploca sp. SIO2C1]